MTDLATEVSKKEVRERKPSGKRGRKFRVPPPAMPVKSLWLGASEEERRIAHETGMVMMEYWLGRVSKTEAARRLQLPPIRVWQLSQRAISGMLAGLLAQPKAKEAMKNPGDDPKALKKRIQELEETVKTQDALIQLLKQMPGIYEERKNEQKALERAQGDGGRVAKTRSSKRHGKDSGRKPEGGSKDPK
jgi:hypothetical protein